MAQPLDEFEFLFGFIGLLLGLAVANIATGLADIWRSRPHARLGACTPLLGLYILISIMGQWINAWHARNLLHIEPWVMLAAVGVTLPFIFVSQAMFPKEPASWASLDAFYLAEAGGLMPALMVSPAVAVVANVYTVGHMTLGDGVRIASTLLVPAALMMWRRVSVHVVGLVLMDLFVTARFFDLSPVFY